MEGLQRAAGRPHAAGGRFSPQWFRLAQPSGRITEFSRHMLRLVRAAVERLAEEEYTRLRTDADRGRGLWELAPNWGSSVPACSLKARLQTVVCKHIIRAERT